MFSRVSFHQACILHSPLSSVLKMFMTSKRFPHVEITKNNNKPSKIVRHKSTETNHCQVFNCSNKILNIALLSYHSFTTVSLTPFELHTLPQTSAGCVHACTCGVGCACVRQYC